MSVINFETVQVETLPGAFAVRVEAFAFAPDIACAESLIRQHVPAWAMPPRVAGARMGREVFLVPAPGVSGTEPFDADADDPSEEFGTVMAVIAADASWAHFFLLPGAHTEDVARAYEWVERAGAPAAIEWGEPERTPLPGTEVECLRYDFL